MKAVYMRSQGGPDVLEWGELPDPRCAPDEIVVDIHAASINGADWKVRKGSGPYSSGLTFPLILGRDFSGVVREAGARVTDLAVGEAVFAVLDRGVEGAYAEQVALKAALAAKKPPSLNHAEAAALALTGLTALIALEETVGLKAGETILIHGGAGGVGSFAVQLAKHLGARVWTTARAQNHGYVKRLGADEAIDYRSQDFVAAAPQCDVVFDTIGGDVHHRSFEVLRPGGRLVHIAPGKPGLAPRADIEILRPHVARDRAHLERVAQLVEQGAVRPPEIKELPLDQAVQAHRESEAGHVRGKIILTVR